MSVRLLDASFDPWAELAATAARLPVGRCGACAAFVGSMRDYNAGREVESLELEHYPDMTRRHLERLIEEARRRWEFEAALILHRVGRVTVGDPIVLVAVWAVHRAPAFAASRSLMEELKRSAPFWKKEFGPDGNAWVTPGGPAPQAPSTHHTG